MNIGEFIDVHRLQLYIQCLLRCAHFGRESGCYIRWRPLTSGARVCAVLRSFQCRFLMGSLLLSLVTDMSILMPCCATATHMSMGICCETLIASGVHTIVSGKHAITSYEHMTIT